MTQDRERKLDWIGPILDESRGLHRVLETGHGVLLQAYEVHAGRGQHVHVPEGHGAHQQRQGGNPALQADLVIQPNLPPDLKGFPAECDLTHARPCRVYIQCAP